MFTKLTKLVPELSIDLIIIKIFKFIKILKKIIKFGETAKKHDRKHTSVTPLCSGLQYSLLGHPVSSILHTVLCDNAFSTSPNKTD